MMRAKSELRDYQDRLISVLYEKDGHLVVLPMGSGKTVSAATAVQELVAEKERRHALVLAPKRVASSVWPDELRSWQHLAPLPYAVLNGSPKSRALILAEAPQRVFTICGIDNAQWLFEELGKLPDDHPLFDILIIDEISRLRSPKSKRAREIVAQADRFRTRWGLSGTPRPNGLEDMFKPLQILTRGVLWGRSFYKWQGERFYPTDWERRHWLIKPDWEAKTLEEAASVSSTLDPADMPSLPELNIIEHFVELPRAARESYDEMQRRLFARVLDVDNASEEEILAASAGVATGKLAQAAQGFMYGEDGNTSATTIHTEKADWLVDHVEAAAGAPMILVYEYLEDLRVLESLFPGIPYIGAGVSDAKANAAVRAWNARELPLMAMHAASGGHGLNLQDGGAQMTWFGLTWSAELWEQTIKRIHRPGQKERCFIHVCLARRTVDEMKRMRVINKLSAQDAFRAYLKTV